jgi:hypothetical protein
VEGGGKGHGSLTHKGREKTQNKFFYLNTELKRPFLQSEVAATIITRRGRKKRGKRRRSRRRRGWRRRERRRRRKRRRRGRRRRRKRMGEEKEEEKKLDSRKKYVRVSRSQQD